MSSRDRARRMVLPLVGAVAAALLVLPVHAIAAEPVAAPAIVSPAQSSVVPSTFVITGRVGPGTTGLRVTGADVVTYTVLPADSVGATFTVTVKSGYGRRVISVTASDGATESAAAVLTVWQLGATPPNKSFVLIDKSDFTLYVVRSRRVVARYYVAIGMRGTPTRTGTFALGPPRPPGKGGSVWGPFRMRLYKKTWVRESYIAHVGKRHVKRWHTVVRRVGTSYYIHGTNDPDSIGTPASHGCVRMFNSQLRKLRDLMDYPRYQMTVIRN